MKQILIVDDEKEIPRLLAAYLKNFGYMVMAANSVEEAAKYLTFFTFDLIITDIHMPNGTGYDLLRFIRSEGITAPVVAVSGAMEAYMASETRDFARTLSKPVPVDEFMNVVRELTEVSAAS